MKAVNEKNKKIILTTRSKLKHNSFQIMPQAVIHQKREISNRNNYQALGLFGNPFIEEL